MRVLRFLIPLFGLAPACFAQASPRYLVGLDVDLTVFISPAPQKGSLLEKRDLHVFKYSRDKVGSARWQLATADVDESIDAMLRNFSGSAAIELTPTTHPQLANMLMKVRLDVAAAIDAAKPQFKRPRPFKMRRGPVCQPESELQTFDFPSGHTSYGTTVALILAELIPNRANAILERGRSYGESRFICGAHSVSAVDAGRQAAGAILAALHGSREFRSDLESVRNEIASGN